jgi:hypothetical protein
MPPTDREFGILTSDVNILKRDMGDLKQKVDNLDGKMDQVLEYMAQEKGGRAERLHNQQQRDNRIELSWTKLGVLATVIGVITGALTIFGHPIAAALLSMK